ncbi:MAG: primosomal protein N', partial [Syntrophothermus sp.]
RVILNPLAVVDPSRLNERELLIYETLLNRRRIELAEVGKILDQQKILPLIKTLLEKGVILMDEELPEKYRKRTEKYVELTSLYRDDELNFKPLFDQLEKKAKKQVDLLMSFLVLSEFGQGQPKPVTRAALLKHSGASAAALDALVKKEVFTIVELPVQTVIEMEQATGADSINLTPAQTAAFTEINAALTEKQVVLLHGVTSSGKTEIYIKFIQETINRGEQVLFLLPEIALTTQIVSRLRKYFGDRVGVYHSRFNENERVEVWNRMLASADGNTGVDIILGARSAVFLPFSRLGLVIVDEEHDVSYKQYDPAPRYNGRDSALYLAHLHKAKTILGSATPSIETYYNCRLGKYALVELKERYGNMQMPEIEVVNLRKEVQQKKMSSHFSSVLLESLKSALDNKEQSIIFQNRRGFSLRLECEICNWMPTCKNCDVTLVYHKGRDLLVCHYCGYTRTIPPLCPSCKGNSLKMKGFGTEKVEEDLSIILPGAKIARMDLDTTRSRFAHQKIIDDLEQQKINILVGTQMVTKGLDFENVSTVSILNADNMLSFPDFRSAERSFQMMAQVSGRSGRKNKRGKVIIQTWNPSNPVIRQVVGNNYQGLFEQQLLDRRKFKYPPFTRLIQIHVKHKDPKVLNKAAFALAVKLGKAFGERVLGPEYPLVSRIMNYYIKQIMIKMEKSSSASEMKRKLAEVIADFQKNSEWKSVRIIIDVDPQ